MCAIKIRDTHRNTRRRRHMSQDTQRSFAFAVMEKERACHQVAFARERLADQICDDRLDIHARVARAGCCDRERVRAVVDERPLDAKPNTVRALCKRDRRIARARRAALRKTLGRSPRASRESHSKSFAGPSAASTLSLRLKWVKT